MELRQLEYMREAIHTKNFATAAQACHVTASSLGQQIRNLEKELGRDLFVRKAGNLCPTDTGLEIARLADRVLDDIDRTKTALKSRGGGHQLRIGYYGNALAPHLGPILAHMHDKHPDVMVRLEEDNPDDLTKSLLNGSVDCALNYLDPSRAGASELNCAHVHDCSYLVVMRKDLMEELADEVDLRDVQLPLMTLTKVQGNRLSYQTGAGTGDLSFTVHAGSNTHRSLLLQAQCGQCAVLIPQDSWEPTAGLEARHISNCEATFSTYLFWRKDSTNVAIKLFRQDVERYFDSLG